MNEMDSFLASVDEFVDDEDRIVTYKWLSRQLAVPTNKSKEILQLYGESCKKRGNQIHIVYIIIGRSANGICMKVARGDEMEAAKTQLDDVISTSVYSVQKVKLLDSATLYSADYSGDSSGNSKLGGIVYNGAVKLTKQEIKKKKQTPGGAKDISGLEKQFAKPATTSNEAKAAQQKMRFFGKTKNSPQQKNLAAEIAVKNEKPQISDSKKSETLTSSKPQKKGGVEAFMTKNKTDPFAKTKTKMKIVKKESEEVNKEPEMAKSSTPTSDSLKKSSPIKENKGEKSPEKGNLPSKRRFEDELKIDDFSDEESGDFVEKKNKKLPEAKSSKRVLESNKNNKKDSAKLQKNRKSRSKTLPAKKRRRIQELSSSSSDEEPEEMEAEETEVIPPSPPPVVPEEVNPTTNKRMKKVLKKKTFLDEEGFMVTEKVWDFEECDEPQPVANGNTDQPEHDNTKPAQAEPLKKKTFPSTSTAAQPKKHTKQASIMGFFKKK